MLNNSSMSNLILTANPKSAQVADCFLGIVWVLLLTCSGPAPDLLRSCGRRSSAGNSLFTGVLTSVLSLRVCCTPCRFLQVYFAFIFFLSMVLHLAWTFPLLGSCPCFTHAAAPWQTKELLPGVAISFCASSACGSLSALKELSLSVQAVPWVTSPSSPQRPLHGRRSHLLHNIRASFNFFWYGFFPGCLQKCIY